MHMEWHFYQVTHENLLVEYKVDFAVLVNHMEHKTIRGETSIVRLLILDITYPGCRNRISNTNKITLTYSNHVRL